MSILSKGARLSNKQLAYLTIPWRQFAAGGEKSTSKKKEQEHSEDKKKIAVVEKFFAAIKETHKYEKL